MLAFANELRTNFRLANPRPTLVNGSEMNLGMILLYDRINNTSTLVSLLCFECAPGETSAAASSACQSEE